jgi:hypothetical protein
MFPSEYRLQAFALASGIIGSVINGATKGHASRDNRKRGGIDKSLRAVNASGRDYWLMCFKH